MWLRSLLPAFRLHCGGHEAHPTVLFRNDATFCRIKGLGNPSGTSFESVNFPKHYIRHTDFELRIDPDNGSGMFAKDATFIVTRPLGGGGALSDDNILEPVEE